MYSMPILAAFTAGHACEAADDALAFGVARP
jgi:hypothetical protein